MIERLGYLISSCAGYETPLQHLLTRLPDSTASRDVRVVAGGYRERSAGHMILAEHIYVPHRSFDYTALIDFVEYAPDYPFWTHVFLLHDTMELGPDSDRLIRQANPAQKATAVWGGECNLALYRVDYLLSRRDELLALKNCTKLRAVEREGFLWRTLPEAERGSYPGALAMEEPGTPYGGALRQCVRYEGVDLIKWKANWGQMWPPSVVTP